MKIKKTMTEKALVANRGNGPQTHGPRNTAFTSGNATKHGILARNLVFRDKGEEARFFALQQELIAYHLPVGPTERELVSNVGFDVWRLSEINGWELEALISRRNVAAAITQALQASGDARQARLLEPALQGWAAQAMVVRSGSRSSEETGILKQDREATADQLFVEAKLTPALESINRYARSVRRDLFQTLIALQELQRLRRELNAGVPASEEGSDGKN